MEWVRTEFGLDRYWQGSALLTTKGDPWVSPIPTSLEMCWPFQNPPEKDIKTCTQEITEALRYVTQTNCADQAESCVNGKDQNSSSQSNPTDVRWKLKIQLHIRSTSFQKTVSLHLFLPAPIYWLAAICRIDQAGVWHIGRLVHLKASLISCTSWNGSGRHDPYSAYDISL